MEETNQAKQSKSTSLTIWGNIAAVVFAIAGVLFTLAPLFTVELKWYEGETKMKDWIAINLISSFSGPYADKSWNWTIIALLVLIGFGIVLGRLSLLFRDKEKVSDGLKIGAVFSYVLAICMVFVSKEAFNSIMQYVEANWGFAVSIAMLSFASVAELSTTESAKKTSTQSIAEDAILIAVAFVLNFIKLFSMPTGGSVNFQMFPLFIIALRHGPAKGLFASGIVYGLLTCITDGYGLYTFPFDYFIGFGSVAVIGFFSKFILNGKDNYNLKGELFIFIACFLATVIRFVGGCTSSMVLYGYTIGASAIYNVGYVGISGLISTAALMALYGPLLKVNKQFPVK